MATKTIEYTIQVEKIEVRDRTPFGPHYAWEYGERVEIFLNVTGYCAELDCSIYFNTPAIERTVLSGPGIAVVTYRTNSQHDSDWLTVPGGYAVGANDPTPHDHPISKINIGQEIKISGRVKKTYAHGISLNFVKLLEA